MYQKKINPEFKWKRYRNVTSKTGSVTGGFPQIYRPTFEAATAHRRLAKAYEEGVLSPLSGENRSQSFIVSQWLSHYGLLYSETHFNNIDIKIQKDKDLEIEINVNKNGKFFDDFFTHAGVVWWIVQVFNLFRRIEHNKEIGLNPSKITRLEATFLKLNVPNPLRVRPAPSSNLTFMPANWADQKIPANEAFQSQINLSNSATTWDTTYLDLLKLIGETIQKNLADDVQFTFVNWANNFVDYPRNNYEKYQGVSNDNATYKVQGFFQPKTLSAFIWLLLAEEFEEIPNIDFENCAGYFDKEIANRDGKTKQVIGCKNVLKRSRVRACKYCNKLVFKKKEKPDSNNGRLLLTTAQGITKCTSKKTPRNLHEHRDHQRIWCSLYCRSRFNTKSENLKQTNRSTLKKSNL